MPGGAPSLDRSGQVDRSTVEQQLFGEGGLAGVRMRDDRKGASVGDAGGECGGGNCGV
jgi:hypothetical protein